MKHSKLSSHQAIAKRQGRQSQPCSELGLKNVFGEPSNYSTLKQCPLIGLKSSHHVTSNIEESGNYFSLKFLYEVGSSRLFRKAITVVNSMTRKIANCL